MFVIINIQKTNFIFLCLVPHHEPPCPSVSLLPLGSGDLGRKASIRSVHPVVVLLLPK